MSALAVENKNTTPCLGRFLLSDRAEFSASGLQTAEGRLTPSGPWELIEEHHLFGDFIFLDTFRQQLRGFLGSYGLPSARKLRDLGVTTSAELPALDAIDTVPRVLKQANLLGLPDEALVPDEDDASAVK